jgi:ribosomal protein S18 acetylase RimI-like enzyme
MVGPAPKLPLPNLDRLRQITGVFTDPDKRRQGHARWLMCEVCVEADQAGTVLLLEPDPFEDDAPLDAGALELFYRRFGFRVIQREPCVLMAREPRVSHSGMK